MAYSTVLRPKNSSTIELALVQRTAMAASIAANTLARADSNVLTIVGGGAQASGQGRAFAGIRSWSEVRIYNRNQPSAVVVAGSAKEAGVSNAIVVDQLDEAIAGADVVALCSGAVTEPWPAGAKELQGFPLAKTTELGSILSDMNEFVRPDEAITVYNSTGHAVQDLAAARVVYLRAAAEGIGLEIDL